MVNYFTNFEWPDGCILRVLLSVSVFPCWSWPGIAALSRPAEFWQRMTQNRLTSLPEGGVEREWEEKGIGDGVETQVVNTKHEEMSRDILEKWAGVMCFLCLHWTYLKHIFTAVFRLVCHSSQHHPLNQRWKGHRSFHRWLTRWHVCDSCSNTSVI